MSNALLLIGTRKGCFLMESDDDRRKWKLRGPFCEGWPVYHAVYDGSSGAIYAAAASEWLGSTVWRSPDLGETWTQSSEGLSYGDRGMVTIRGLDGPVHVFRVGVDLTIGGVRGQSKQRGAEASRSGRKPSQHATVGTGRITVRNSETRCQSADAVRAQDSARVPTAPADTRRA